MNVKTNKTKKQANVENQAVNLLSKEELCKRIEGVEKELKSYTWRELETNGKFAKNDKLSFITDAEEFKELHVYYTTRADNPLKKMQSLIVIACKILRVIYTILKTGKD